MDALPFTIAELSEQLPDLKIEAGDRIAIGVSGGADSLCLTLLLGEWCKEHGVFLTALTVDHGLRAAAAGEAKQVTAWLETYDIPHVILCWRGEKPRSNIQQLAREARYHIMGEWCVSHKVNRLFLAHHRDDQAETFLMRLFRGSGVDGLAAMTSIAEFPVSLVQGNVTLYRPLLSITKDRLCATLHSKGQQWIEDPSNNNDSYTRIKVRKLMQDSDIEGLSTDRMADTATRMGRVKSLLQSLTDDLREKTVSFFPEGYAEICLSDLLAAHEEIALRLLASQIRLLSGGRYTPRLVRLESLYDRLKNSGFSGQTLGGCQITIMQNDQIIISREVAAIDDILPIGPHEKRLWDGRFIVESGDLAGEVRKLEPGHWQELCQKNPELKMLKLSKIVRAKIVRESLPILLTTDGEILLPDFIPGFEKKGFFARFRQ